MKTTLTYVMRKELLLFIDKSSEIDPDWIISIKLALIICYHVLVIPHYVGSILESFTVFEKWNP